MVKKNVLAQKSTASCIQAAPQRTVIDAKRETTSSDKIEEPD